MPYVQSEGVQIYYEVHGEGPALLLQHGTLGSREDWRAIGYFEALKDQYQIVLVDARGHGKSDKPHENEAYQSKNFAKDVLAVMDDAGLEKVIFWGYSLGARIGFELANIAPHRVQAFILGGGSPYLRESSLNIDGGKNDQIAARDAVLGSMGMTYDGLPVEAQEAISGNDFIAIAATYITRPSLENVLPKMTMPCLVYVGENDGRFEKAKKSAQEIPGAIFRSLPNLSHLEGLVVKEAVMPHILEFLSKLAR